MVKRTMRGKKTKMRNSRKRYDKKQYIKKRYIKKRSKKRNSKKKTLKGGKLTPEQEDLLTKVESDKRYCRKKNIFQNRTREDCDDKKSVCKWDTDKDEGIDRCMKDKNKIDALNYWRPTQYYPPFTPMFYINEDGEKKETTIPELSSKYINSEVGDDTQIWMNGMENWGSITDYNFEVSDPFQAQIVHYTIKGRKKETTIDDLASLKEDGTINDETLVWMDGMDENDWTPLGKTNFLELKDDIYLKPSVITEDETTTSEEVDDWLRKREEYKNKVPKEKPYFIYFDPGTNINIVCEVLKREAKRGSNIYLHLDAAHGELSRKRKTAVTKLNSNLHLILNVARGTPSIIAFTRLRDEKMMPMLSTMKKYLDNGGYTKLFKEDKCMTLNGSLLFYSMLFISILDHELANIIMHDIIRQIKPDDRSNDDEIKLSTLFRLTYARLSLRPREERLWLDKTLLFKILKLYNPGEEVNDTCFDVREAMDERKAHLKKGQNFDYNQARWGLTILYTTESGEDKYIHLPLNEDRFGEIYLSEIIDYLKPLERLKHNFFMKHGSCRTDDEENKISEEEGSLGLPTEYNPDLDSLTRELSSPKEEEQKECFINDFKGRYDDVAVSFVREALKEYPTMVDYYTWLQSVEKLEDYIAIIRDYGEGSPQLAEFITGNN